MGRQIWSSVRMRVGGPVRPWPRVKDSVAGALAIPVGYASDLLSAMSAAASMAIQTEISVPIRRGAGFRS